MAIQNLAIDNDNCRVALRAQVQPDITYFHRDRSFGSVHIDLQFDVCVVKRDAHYWSDEPTGAIDYQIISGLSRHAIMIDHNLVPL